MREEGVVPEGIGKEMVQVVCVCVCWNAKRFLREAKT